MVAGAIFDDLFEVPKIHTRFFFVGLLLLWVKPWPLYFFYTCSLEFILNMSVDYLQSGADKGGDAQSCMFFVINTFISSVHFVR